MDTLSYLKDQQQISTNEAIDALYQLVKHYSAILQNIIRIKQQHPEEGQGFRRRAPSNLDLLQELAQALEQLNHDLHHVENAMKDKQHSVTAYNKKIMAIMNKAIARCEAAYENKAASFAMILQDLQSLRVLLREKLILDDLEVEGSTKASRGIMDLPLGADEKYVYVRLFHREMAKLGSPNASLAWSTSLLESIKMAEKLGLAIYETESLVNKSLKSECYGYATVKIRQQQDVTQQHGEKLDPQLGCTLLSITAVEIEQIIKFTHRGVDYPVVEGKLRPPIT